MTAEFGIETHLVQLGLELTVRILLLRIQTVPSGFGHERLRVRQFHDTAFARCLRLKYCTSRYHLAGTMVYPFIRISRLLISQIHHWDSVLRTHCTVSTQVLVENRCVESCWRKKNYSSTRPAWLGRIIRVFHRFRIWLRCGVSRHDRGCRRILRVDR